ncbi:MAG: protease complex subunit PrcB family protein [Eubacterium ramulus]
MKRISSIFTVSLLVPILGLTGCGLQKTGTQKVRDLDYTVVTEQELPEELQKEIDERYTEDFKMTCMLDDSRYIVRGFGMQETGGYSIQVQDLYLAQNAIYFEADLHPTGKWCGGRKGSQLSVYRCQYRTTGRKCGI